MVAADAGDEGFVFACKHVGGRLEIGPRVWALFWCHLRRLLLLGLPHFPAQHRVAKAVFDCVCVFFFFWFVQKQKNNGEQNCIFSVYSLEPKRGDIIR